jgi:hypothetical protein
MTEQERALYTPEGLRSHESVKRRADGKAEFSENLKEIVYITEDNRRMVKENAHYFLLDKTTIAIHLNDRAILTMYGALIDINPSNVDGTSICTRGMFDKIANRINCEFLVTPYMFFINNEPLIPALLQDSHLHNLSKEFKAECDLINTYTRAKGITKLPYFVGITIENLEFHSSDPLSPRFFISFICKLSNNSLCSVLTLIEADLRERFRTGKSPYVDDFFRLPVFTINLENTEFDPEQRDLEVEVQLIKKSQPMNKEDAGAHKHGTQKTQHFNYRYYISTSFFFDSYHNFRRFVQQPQDSTEQSPKK